MKKVKFTVHTHDMLECVIIMDVESETVKLMCDFWSGVRTPEDLAVFIAERAWEVQVEYGYNYTGVIRKLTELEAFPRWEMNDPDKDIYIQNLDEFEFDCQVVKQEEL